MALKSDAPGDGSVSRGVVLARKLSGVVWLTKSAPELGSENIAALKLLREGEPACLAWHGGSLQARSALKRGGEAARFRLEPGRAIFAE